MHTSDEIGRTATNKTSNTEHLLHGDHQIFKYFTGPPMESNSKKYANTDDIKLTTKAAVNAIIETTGMSEEEILVEEKTTA